jgi:hypothetical protein
MKTKANHLKVITMKVRKASKLKTFNFDRFLKRLGFTPKRSCGIGYPRIFIHKKKKVVVKRPYVAGTVDVPEKGIKTAVVRFRPRDDYDENNYIFIQPFADVSRKARNMAYDILSEWSDNFNGYADDMHSQNVAMYNGQAVRIDW